MLAALAGAGCQSTSGERAPPAFDGGVDAGGRPGDDAAPAPGPQADGGGAVAPPSELCERDTWCWYNPVPEGGLGEGGWGASGNELWLSSRTPGTVLHYGGGVW